MAEDESPVNALVPAKGDQLPKYNGVESLLQLGSARWRAIDTTIADPRRIATVGALPTVGFSRVREPTVSQKTD